MAGGWTSGWTGTVAAAAAPGGIESIDTLMSLEALNTAGLSDGEQRWVVAEGETFTLVELGAGLKRWFPDSIIRKKDGTRYTPTLQPYPTLYYISPHTPSYTTSHQPTSTT